MASGIEVRFAKDEDCGLILDFIKALATYEKMLDEVTATEDKLRATLFGPNPRAECLLAWDRDSAIGFALFFHNYSTFLGQPGLYLEDLFVTPEARGKGAGRLLLQKLAALARERECGRLEWAVLDWNKPAIDFYRSLGAEAMDEWTVYRLTGGALSKLAAETACQPS